MPFSYSSSDAVRVYEKGDYRAQIDFVAEKKSRAGKDMLEVKVGVYNAEGRRITITDYIVSPSTIWKLEQIALAIGENEAFVADRLDLTQHVGAVLVARLVIEDSEKYGKQNKIAGYKPASAVAEPVAEDDDDDSVPF